MKIQRASVRLEFSGLLLAGLPKDPDVLKYANIKRKEKDKQVKDVKAGDLPTDGEEMEGSSCVFRRTDKGKPAVDEHVVRAVIREAIKKHGKSRLMRGMWDACYTDPYLIPLKTSNGKLETEFRAFPTITPQGPRNVVNKHEAAVQPTIEFELQLHMPKDKYNIADCEKLLNYAGRFVCAGAGGGKSGLKFHYGMFKVGQFKVLPLAEIGL